MIEFVSAFLGCSFLGMVLAIRVVIKFSYLAETIVERLMILFCLAFVYFWWAGLLWLILNWKG